MSNPRDRIGETIDDRYRLTKLIGRGAMADVFGAQDLVAHRVVAVKILRQAGDQAPETARRFMREARAQEMIQHRNVAALYGGGATARGELFLVVQLLRGKSLLTRLRRHGPMNVLQATNYCWQALQGLAAMHTLGIFHRDLKPANIMLEPNDDGTERAVLIDLGFAALQGAPRLTQRGHVVGSLSYMAPERLTGNPSDERSDIYAMGIILYELLVGRPPFVADDDYQLISAHLDQAPVPPSQQAPERHITPSVERVILQALEKNPDKRPQSATHMARELERATFSLDPV